MTIERRLVHFDRDGECRVVDPGELESNVDPVVILGDAGVGKTALLRGLCERTDLTYIHASTLVRSEDPASLIPEDACPPAPTSDTASTGAALRK